MSTRANVSLQWKTRGEAFRPPEMEIILYSHYDGYPDELGADIAQFILDQLSDHRKRMEGKPNGYYAGERVDFNTLVRQFLNDSRPFIDGEPDRHTYEITTGIHGDIEHHYQVILAEKGERLVLTHAARVRYEEGDWITNRRTSYTLNGFIDMVNRERKKSNARIRELKAANPNNKRYQECELYEIICNWTADDDEAAKLAAGKVEPRSPEEDEARHLTDAGGGAYP